LFLTTKIAPNTKENVANNIRYCIKQVAGLTLGFIPFFKDIIDTINTGTINPIYFDNWLNKKLKTDNDYRHIRNVIKSDDSLHQFVKENNLYNDVYSWLYSYYNITKSDIKQKRTQTIVDKFYHNTPTVTIIQPDDTRPVQTHEQILKNIDDYFSNLHFKVEKVEQKHEHIQNHLCSVEFKKGMVPIFIEHEGEKLNNSSLNIFYRKNLTSIVKLIKRKNVNLLGYISRTTPIHNHIYL